MTFEERVKREMKRLAACRGHAMSSYRKGGDAAFPFRSDCARCGGHIELGFGLAGARSFAPRGRAPFDGCKQRRTTHQARRATT